MWLVGHTHGAIANLKSPVHLFQRLSPDQIAKRSIGNGLR